MLHREILVFLLDTHGLQITFISELNKEKYKHQLSG